MPKKVRVMTEEMIRREKICKIRHILKNLNTIRLSSHKGPKKAKKLLRELFDFLPPKVEVLMYKDLSIVKEKGLNEGIWDLTDVKNYLKTL